MVQCEFDHVFHLVELILLDELRRTHTKVSGKLKS